MKVAVFGARGRMGAEVVRAVEAAEGLELVGAVDAGDDRSAAERAEVVVDFTHPDAVMGNIEWCTARGINVVVGTTGFTDDDIAGFRAAFTSSNCLIAPNFAIGALLMMKFAALAAPYFETAEIIEFHHAQKVDAPSGTAVLTAQRIAEASSDWAPDPTTSTVYEGARGGVGADGIHIHSFRIQGMVAHQEVVLGTTGQTLVIRHDSIDRTSFMPGVLMGTKAIADHPGVTVGLDTLLGL